MAITNYEHIWDDFVQKMNLEVYSRKGVIVPSIRNEKNFMDRFLRCFPEDVEKKSRYCEHYKAWSGEEFWTDHGEYGIYFDLWDGVSESLHFFGVRYTIQNCRKLFEARVGSYESWKNNR